MIAQWQELPELFDGDLAVGPLYADRPPTRGLAGWTDWRLGDPIAAAMQKGRLEARPGEKLLVAGRAPFRVPRLLFIGCEHPARDRDEEQKLGEAFGDAVAGIGGKRLLIEVPAERAETFMRVMAERAGLHDDAELYFYFPEAPCRI